MYAELPNVDYLMTLLNKILLVRAEGLLELEEELYNELVFIHRDPHLLIERTRDKSAELSEILTTKKRKSSLTSAIASLFW